MATFCAKKLRESSLSLRRNSYTDPCSALVPDLVTMATVTPPFHPYSAEEVEVTRISAIASGGAENQSPSEPCTEVIEGTPSYVICAEPAGAPLMVAVM